MTELFRFVLMPPPVPPSPEEVKLLGASFIPASATSTQAMGAAKKAVQGGKLLAADEEVPGAGPARAVVELLEKGPQPTVTVTTLVEGVAGQSPKALVAGKQFEKSVTSVSVRRTR